MSFASMHNDYLDPDRAGLNDENWGTEYEGIIAALKQHDSGGWGVGVISVNEAWFKSLSSRYSAFAYDLKRRGFTYCQIMDYFAGKGFK